MEQTAVEWLCEKYHLKQDTEIINQAKEMEKKQIIDAFKNGDCNGTFETINSEQYYNKTFKQD